MFYYVSGTVAHVEPYLAVIDCGGVGYACRTTTYTLSGLKKGFTDPDDLTGKAETYALVRRMSDRLKAAHGSVICRQLLGLPEGMEREESAKPQERTPEYYASRPCSGIVRTAATIVEEELLPELFSEPEAADRP